MGDALPSFEELYGYAAAVTAAAHGRVNLIGEHTDYNGGFVLPVPIPQRTKVALAPRAGSTARLATALCPGPPREYILGEEERTGIWMDYVQGVTAIVRAEGLEIAGFDARIESEVPAGSGLASSAALTVALLRALRQAFHLDIDDIHLALLAQRAENEFVGARVGIMDPMVAVFGVPGTALFLDARSLEWQRVPMPDAIALIVIHSGITHANASGAYNARRAECERACALLGVVQLRDLRVRDLPPMGRLPPPLDRRVRHVVTENERVRGAVQALRLGAWRRLGELLTWSHESLRDDYEVSTPEIDQLVSLLAEEPGVYGARLTGGGFGGCIVAVADAAVATTAARTAATRYTAASGQAARVLLPP